jgi:hypothetical protein
VRAEPSRSNRSGLPELAFNLLPALEGFAVRRCTE